MLRFPSKRRLIQLYSALLYNAHLKGFLTGRIFSGASKALCTPGLNCYSCPGAVAACPLGALQNALASHRTGFYVFGILLLYGLLFGRAICGFLCPFGLIQELLHKLPLPKLKKSPLTRLLSNLKYILLLVFVLFIPLYSGFADKLPLPGFCKYICPAGTLEGALFLLPANPALSGAAGPLFSLKLAVLLLILISCAFCYRAFCRFFCPLGAIYGLFNRLSLTGIKVEASRCTGCGRCVKACKTDIRRPGDRECVCCGECVGVCPENAIALKAGRLSLRVFSGKTEPAAGVSPQKTESPACGDLRGEKPAANGNIRKHGPSPRLYLALSLLAAVFVLCAANLPEKPAENGQPTVRENLLPGSSLPAFSAECLDGTVFLSEEHKGKPLFINLWATWCAPCVRELPEFAALSHAHEGDIAVLAIHASLTTEDPGEYLGDKGWDIPFALDRDGGLFRLFGASSALPQTIVVNREGRVIYNEAHSVDRKLLEELYQEAAAQP